MKLTARFRIKNNVPFAIERVSGLQYRCGLCGKVFFDRKVLDKHLLSEKSTVPEKLQFPELERNVSISVIYTQDIRDLTNAEYPRLNKGDNLFLNQKKNTR